MKRIILSLAISFCMSLFFNACSSDSIPSFNEEGFTFENYPRVDGSTSTSPLQTIIACRLLGINYNWEQLLIAYFIWEVKPDFDAMPANFWEERIKVSQTHQSIINLIDGQADLILSARKMSKDEKEYAENKGVTLIETPIALDALIFLANPENKVKSLTSNEVQSIYAGEITNWKDVSGDNKTITPFIRNANSGSQELMETLVMTDKEIADWPESHELSSMIFAFSEVMYDPAGLSYTVQYYKENIVRNKEIKTLSINGIYPEKKSLVSRAYPYTSEIYVSIRSDLDINSMAYKLYLLLQTNDGKSLINESGYIPYQ